MECWVLLVLVLRSVYLGEDGLTFSSDVFNMGIKGYTVESNLEISG